jgi:hypothetical protein
MFDYSHQPEIWIQLLGIAAFMVLVMDTPLWDRAIRWLRIPFKPFTCPKCMAFWISLVYFQDKFSDPLYTVFLSAITGAVAGIIDNQTQVYNG